MKSQWWLISIDFVPKLLKREVCNITSFSYCLWCFPTGWSLVVLFLGIQGFVPVQMPLGMVFLYKKNDFFGCETENVPTCTQKCSPICSLTHKRRSATPLMSIFWAAIIRYRMNLAGGGGDLVA